jgi:murein DD-endopeptidase MepM/ murein hydrolase activator NlpD
VRSMTVTARHSGRYRSARRRRRRRSARPSGRAALLALASVAFLLTLLLAAFGSPSPDDGAAVSASAARLAPAGRPLGWVIAMEGSLAIRMPISQRQVTAIGYHGAGQDALPLQPVGHQANEGLVSRIFHSLFGGSGSTLSYYQMGGGEGPSTGGLDVGAAAGTDVYSPVDGTVVSIQPYVIDGQQYGHVVQIQPSGAPSVVVSLTQLRADPALAVGSPVSASTTKVGTVLDFSKVEQQALARYSHDSGNHVALTVTPAVPFSLP